MLIVMDHHSTSAQVKAVVRRIEDMGFTANPIPGENRLAIGITGNPGPLDPGDFESLPGVLEAIAVTRPYKLVSREVKPESTVVRVGDVEVGGEGFIVIAGPCAVENERQTLTAARQVRAAGAHMLRGGAFKPRTSPYSFQGLGRPGLEILQRAGKETGLPVVTEALDEESLGLVVQYADVVQIGARNMQNFSLLKRAGRCGKPVFLKRGMSATLDELLMAAEYLAAEGNYGIMLCERGVRTFGTHARNTLDLSVVPAAQDQSHLPMFVDPSHGTGRRDRVAPLARAGLAVGADGLMIEVHPEPDAALSDGPQALLPAQFQDLMDVLRQMAPLLGRKLAPARGTSA
ncbi:MAG: 3-deoxy-7-phosphoheptulonate synthase [Acidobacteria bacterium]|nr:3-deoxy-7-phosphoheptulonate synthase [Acidobacteriota bacterium]